MWEMIQFQVRQSWLQSPASPLICLNLRQVMALPERWAPVCKTELTNTAHLTCISPHVTLEG